MRYGSALSVIASPPDRDLYDIRQPGDAPPAVSTSGRRIACGAGSFLRIGFQVGLLVGSSGLILAVPLMGAFLPVRVRMPRPGMRVALMRLEHKVADLTTLGEEVQITVPLQETVVTPPPPPKAPRTPPSPLALSKVPVTGPAFGAAPEVSVPTVAAIKQIILSASQRYGVPYGRLLSVAECESSLNPLAVNRSSGATGLFQFMPATFYGHGGTDLWSPTQQADIAAKMFSIGESSEWVCK